MKKKLEQIKFENKLMKMPMKKMLAYLDEVDFVDDLILQNAQGSKEKLAKTEREIAQRKKERFEFIALRLLSEKNLVL